MSNELKGELVYIGVFVIGGLLAHRIDKIGYAFAIGAITLWIALELRKAVRNGTTGTPSRGRKP